MLLLLAFTLLAGLLYLLILKPALSDVTRSVAPVSEPVETEPLTRPAAQTRSKAARRMVSVTATIRDAFTGAPLPGARATVLDVEDIAEPMVRIEPGGRLFIDFLPPSIFFGVQIECAGYRPHTFRRLRDRAKSIIHLGQVALEPLRALSGTVRDRPGLPIADCTVTLFPISAVKEPGSAFEFATLLADAMLQTPVASVRSGADGEFRIEQLPPDRYALYCVGKPHGSLLLPDVDLRFADGQVRVRMEQAPLIRGRLRLGNGETVAGSTVICIEASDRIKRQLSAALSRVDESGFFAHASLAPLPHYVFSHGTRVAASGHGPRLFPFNEEAELAVEAGVEMIGTVVDIDSLPVKGARVSVISEARGALTLPAWTDDTGTFTIAGLPPGPALALVVAEGFAPTRTALPLLPATEPERIILREPVGLTGTVRSGAAPLAGAVVSSSRPDRRSLSGPNGHFKLADIPAGPLLVRAAAPGHATHEQTIEVRLQSDNRLDIELLPGGELRVLVRGEDDLPIDGARVLAVPADAEGRLALRPAGSSVTDSRGLCRIGQLDGGPKVVLIALADGFPPVRSEPFEVRPEHAASGVALTVHRGAGVTGRVVDGAGAVVPWVRVSARTAAADDLYQSTLALIRSDTWTDADGEFVLSDLPTGTYQLQAERAGWSTRSSEEIRLKPNSLVKGFELALDPAPGVSGTVLDPDGQPVGGALVEAIVFDPESGNPVPATTGPARPLPCITDLAGRFEIIRPGRDGWSLRASKAGLPDAVLPVEATASPPHTIQFDAP